MATLLILGVAFVAHEATSGRSTHAVALTPGATVHAFVSRYEQADGRIERTDQGGDTVSEGQAYALLMTAAIGDRPDFDRAWKWTQANLQHADGLLSWQWKDGRVANSEAATDADLGTAAALVIGGLRFNQPALTSEAQRLANSIIAREVVQTAYGPTLVAGPWATGPTEYVDPSYLAPAELAVLSRAFGAPWRAIGSAADVELEALTSNGDLPSDWAVIGSDSAIHPSTPPGNSGQVAMFGFDAVRTPIWMATSCSSQVRQAANATLPALRRGQGEVNLDLGGNPSHATQAPVGLLALAAGEWAAGAKAPAWDTVRQADAANSSDPTYYGSAWLALTVLAFDNLLGGC